MIISERDELHKQSGDVTQKFSTCRDGGCLSESSSKEFCSKAGTCRLILSTCLEAAR